MRFVLALAALVVCENWAFSFYDGFRGLSQEQEEQITVATSEDYDAMTGSGLGRKVIFVPNSFQNLKQLLENPKAQNTVEELYIRFAYYQQIPELEGLGQFVHLKHLKVYFCGATLAVSPEVFTQPLQKLQGLVSLDLHGSLFAYEQKSREGLRDALAKLPNLVELNLVMSGLVKEEGVMVVPWNSPKLKEVLLAGNHFEEVGKKRLMEELKSRPDIQIPEFDRLN